MQTRLTPATLALLLLPPLLWAGNAVVGRMVHTLIPPMTFNLLRWLIAGVLVLPLAWRALLPASEVWRLWPRFALLGLLGVGSYNALQYLALQTSQPLNITLVGASLPVWTLLIGRLFFGARAGRAQLAGAALSLGGVLVVLSHGDWDTLRALRLVPGDALIVVATIAWATYGWLLARPKESAALRGDWSAFLLAQIVFGSLWAGAFTGLEWTLGTPQVHWGWPLAAALAFVAIGPAVVAYRCFGIGVQRVGPNVSAFFYNLTPLFAALLSAAFLGELPHAYHAAAFALIVAGIVLSTRKPAAAGPCGPGS
ncbi:MAG: DMT family transporter [Pseudomonadota bacterium]